MDCTTHILSLTAVAFKVYYILFVVGNDQTNIVSVQALVIYLKFEKDYCVWAPTKRLIKIRYPCGSGSSIKTRRNRGKKEISVSAKVGYLC